MKNGFVTIKSAAEILDKSVETLRNWDKSGKLKAVRGRNGYRMYKISELEKFARKYSLKRSQSKIKLVLN